MSRAGQTARLLARAEQRYRDDMWRVEPIAAPVDVTDAEQFPEIARAVAGLAAMSPEKRAALEAEWDA